MGSKKIIALAGAILFAVGIELFLSLYNYWIFIIPVSLILIILELWLVTTERFFSKEFWMYIITPFFFMLAIFGMISLLESSVIQQALILGGALLYWLYLGNVAIYHFDFQNYHTSAIENVSSYMNLISLFCLTIVAYAAEALLNTSLAIMGVMMIFFVVLILLQSIWAAHIDSQKRLLYVLTMAIIMIESFWVVAYLPSNFYLQGFLLTVTYYGVWGLLKSNLLGIFSKRLLIRYLGLCGLAVIAVIITAQWI